MALPILEKHTQMELTVNVSACQIFENEGRYTLYSVEVYDSNSDSVVPLGSSQLENLAEAIAEAFSTLRINQLRMIEVVS